MQPARVVKLNVYELVAFDQYRPYLAWTGMHAHHSGVEIGGEEYSFGAHAFNFSGVFSIQPRTASNCRFLETITIGETRKTYTEIKEILNNLGNSFTGTSYNVCKRNCNHFTNELCVLLTGNGIPGYINRLAYVGSFVQCLIPQLNPPTGQDEIMEHQESPVQPFSGEGFRLQEFSPTAGATSSSELSADSRRERAAAAALKRVNGSS